MKLLLRSLVELLLQQRDFQLLHAQGLEIVTCVDRDATQQAGNYPEPGVELAAISQRLARHGRGNGGHW